jgi:hypothetical protein
LFASQNSIGAHGFVETELFGAVGYPLINGEMRHERAQAKDTRTRDADAGEEDRMSGVDKEARARTYLIRLTASELNILWIALDELPEKLRTRIRATISTQVREQKENGNEE